MNTDFSKKNQPPLQTFCGKRRVIEQSEVLGCIESVLLKKCDVEYWNNGAAYTDRFITLWMNGIFG